MPKPVALITDFGTSDHYAGVMRAVIAGICPDVRIIDITHGVEPGNAVSGSYMVKASYPHLPEGSVVACVVDPEVGGERRILCVRTDSLTFISPDNGLLSYVFRDFVNSDVFSLDVKALSNGNASPTFHGRDVIAPAAARLAAGEPIEAFAAPTEDAVVLSHVVPEVDNTLAAGLIIHIDRYGNCITNIEQHHLGNRKIERIEVDDLRLSGLVSYYAEAVRHEPLALIGSSGHLEISVRDGSAAKSLGLSWGDDITVLFER